MRMDIVSESILFGKRAASLERRLRSSILAELLLLLYKGPGRHREIHWRYHDGKGHERLQRGRPLCAVDEAAPNGGCPK